MQQTHRPRPEAGSKSPIIRAKAPHDTVVGCRGRAEADLLASVAMLTANERVRLETSAASWTARANLLQRMDDSNSRPLGRMAPNA